MSQILSKCCEARVYQDNSFENDPSETPKWRCVKCKKVVDKAIIRRT
jgi:hypothetical protein